MCKLSSEYKYLDYNILCLFHGTFWELLPTCPFFYMPLQLLFETTCTAFHLNCRQQAHLPKKRVKEKSHWMKSKSRNSCYTTWSIIMHVLHLIHNYACSSIKWTYKWHLFTLVNLEHISAASWTRFPFSMYLAHLELM